MPHKARRSVYLLPIHHTTYVELIKLQVIAKKEIEANGRKNMYSKLAEIRNKIP